MIVYNVYRKYTGYSTYTVLVFLDNERTDKRMIAKYIEWMHDSNVGIEFITLDDHEIYKLNLNKYFRFYIVPQQRKYRSELREKFFRMVGRDIHIQLYSKLVVAYKRHALFKASIGGRNWHYPSSARIEFQIRDWYR